MKNIDEKEKKLSELLETLKNLDLLNPQQEVELNNLKKQKNQLEIEKKELQKKFNDLEEENLRLKSKCDHLTNINEDEKKKEINFSEKIDELNQETDSLLEEIDKWQM